jgi:DNA-directed RNA polymerase subunit RPC12/RpoP
MKDETDDNFWKCPHCGAVEEFDLDMPKSTRIECSECGDKSEPHSNLAMWEDFWVYCQSLKDV